MIGSKGNCGLEATSIDCANQPKSPLVVLLPHEAGSAPSFHMSVREQLANRRKYVCCHSSLPPFPLQVPTEHSCTFTASSLNRIIIWLAKAQLGFERLQCWECSRTPP